jgi:Tol biopolymer transport system component/tRNA A-37 threonylcarbamoyl transferase component Bud32
VALTLGTRLGAYEILGAIGAGGMGEVYRARDTRLGRDVAIKVLPAAFTEDAERVARFRREAQVLATLNHPNIAAIYGLEESPSPGAGHVTIHALVMELVEGEDLAARLKRGAMPVADVIAIARQIALGLEEAHEKGIVHRDLKPANLRLTPDGKVKILDFGLAKAYEDDVAAAVPSIALSQAPTASRPLTEAGVVYGTPAYMSPEQARGLTLDQRSDIWAFGCVLYEMLTGRRAFAGQTTSDIIAKILEREPDWTALPAHTSASIRRDVRRCLQKNPKQRLRHIGDIVLELDSIADGDPVAAEIVHARPGKWTWRVMGAAALVALVAAGTGWFAGRRSSAEPPPTFGRMVRLVSTAAHEFGPAISPDGKWVAYLSDARGPTDVWVKFIAGGDPVNLTASANIDVQAQDVINGLEVSPDGTQIAFQEGTGQLGAAWVIPAPLGGVPHKVLPTGSSGLRWSLDGQRIAYIKTGGPLGDALVVSDADGQHEQEIAKREGARHIHWIRWSPDGRFVYFNRGPQNFNTEPTEIWRVASTGGLMEPVISTARRAAYPALSPDGLSLIYAANRDTPDLSLWRRDLTTGRDYRLTSGVGDYSEPSLSADGTRLVGTVTEVRQSLERVPVTFDRSATLEPLTDGLSGDFDPVWSPDGGRLVFSSSRTGHRTLWSARDRLAQPAPLTSGAAFDERPAYSPDGRQIAFVSDRGGHRGIWVVNVEGGTPRFVASADVVDTISWSPDGRRLVYATPVGDAPGLRIMTVADGQTIRLPTNAAAVGPAWSPREDVIAFIEPRGGGLGAYVQLVRPDGQPVTPHRLDGPDAPRIGNGFVAWSADGRRLAAASLPGASAGSIWIVEPANPVPYRKLMDLPAGVFLRGATWARDGSSLVVGRVRWMGDIFLAEKPPRP